MPQQEHKPSVSRLYSIEVDVHTCNLQEVKLLPVAGLSYEHGEPQGDGACHMA